MTGIILRTSFVRWVCNARAARCEKSHPTATSLTPDVLPTKVIDSITGNYVDQFSYSKPYGWQPDMARQLATIASYKANGSGYVPVVHEATGTPYAGAQRCSSWLTHAMVCVLAGDAQRHERRQDVSQG